MRDFREVLADRSIDAVCISTPDHWHPYITVEACKAGKDVYVEKPACVAVEKDWPWCARRASTIYSYFRHFWDYAGGHLTDSGRHMPDIVHLALGDVMPDSVVALGGKYWLRMDSETPDTLQVTYEYPGCIASWEHRCNNTDGLTSRLMGITFHGSRGALCVDRALYKLTPEKGSDLEPAEV